MPISSTPKIDSTFCFDREMHVLVDKMNILAINDVPHEIETNSTPCDKPYTGPVNLPLVLISSLKGTKVSTKDEYGMTSFHYAAQLGRLERLKELLLVEDLYIDYQNKEGSTMLHLAALSSSIECVRLVLSLLPNVNLRDIDGYTPLHWVAFNNRKDSEMTHLLLSVPGIDLSLKNRDGKTPKEFAEERKATHFLKALSSFTRPLSTVQKIVNLKLGFNFSHKIHPSSRK